MTMTVAQTLARSYDEPKTLDEFHWHEAMDRAVMCAEVIEGTLLILQPIKQTPDLKHKAEMAIAALVELYSMAGEIRFDESQPWNANLEG